MARLVKKTGQSYPQLQTDGPEVMEAKGKAEGMNPKHQGIPAECAPAIPPPSEGERRSRHPPLLFSPRTPGSCPPPQLHTPHPAGPLQPCLHRGSRQSWPRLKGPRSGSLTQAGKLASFLGMCSWNEEGLITSFPRKRCKQQLR